MHGESEFAQQHLSRRFVRQRKSDPSNLDIADLAAWAKGEVIIVRHYANRSSVDLWHLTGDCLCPRRLSAAQQCGDEAAENRRPATAKNVAPCNAIFVKPG